MKILVLAAIAALSLFSAPAMAGNGGHMGDGGSSATAVSQSAASNSNRQSVTDKRQAPGFGVGGLTSTGECPIGSWTAAISTPWGGLGGGKTINEQRCLEMYMLRQGKFPLRVTQTYIQQQSPAIAQAVKAVYGR